MQAKKPAKKLPHYHVTAGLIWKGDKLLIARRNQYDIQGGLWEFPGGKKEEGETLEECLQRELFEELRIRVEVKEENCTVKHAYNDFRITLHVFKCQFISGPPQAVSCSEWKWISPGELRKYTFPPADLKVIEMLVHRNGRGGIW